MITITSPSVCVCVMEGQRECQNYMSNQFYGTAVEQNYATVEI